MQVNTHMAPVPSPGRAEPVHVPGVEHETALQVASDGHGHGPLNAYANNFTASTQATMSKAPTSAFSSTRFG